MSHKRRDQRRKPGRFNEELETQSRKSNASKISRASKQHSNRPQPAVESRGAQPKFEDLKAQNPDPSQKVAQHLEDYREHRDDDLIPENNGEEQKGEHIPDSESQLHDEIDSLYYGDSYSQYTGASQRTGKTNATYISKLEKELDEERHAREKLEKELEEIKKISSEISSHLGLSKNLSLIHI